MQGRTRSLILLSVAVVVWGGTYVVTKTGLDDLPPMFFALVRFTLASLVLLALALARGSFAALPRPLPWGTLILMSLTGIALYYMGFNLALTFTTASQGALVQSSIPAVTAITAAIMLHERITRRLAIGIGLAIAGVFLIVGGGGDHAARSPLIGNAIMVGTVIVWAMYTVYAKRTAHLDPLAVTAIVFLIGTLMLVPAAVIEAARGPTPHVSPASWARIIYLAVFASAGGFLLYSRALRDLDASLAGVFVNMSPVIGAVSGVLLLHEPIAPLAIVGGVLVLAGLWLGIRGP